MQYQHLILIGEKLDNIERRFEDMNVDLNRADKNITELEKVCGCCVCPTLGPKSVTVSFYDGYYIALAAKI